MTDTNYFDSFKTYIKDLAAKKPSPGGGSALALSLCLALALIEKALNYSLNVNTGLKRYANTFRKLRAKAGIYVDLDAAVFKKFMQARGKRKIAGLKDCNAITQSVVKIAKDANNYAKMVESGVKKSIISDFHIGCALLYVVLEGCALNLEENNKFLGAWQRKTSKP